jgi:photosystem II stability/assembly factor-like uncharacterized protein
VKLRHVSLSISIIAVAGLVLAAYAQKPGSSRSPSEISKDKHEVDDAQIIRARANWFYRQRAYPLKHIPAFARERAWNTMRQMQQRQRTYLQQKYGAHYSRLSAAAALAAGAVNTAASWVPIGPEPTNEYFFQPYVSGRVTAMVVDPCDSTGNTVLLGGAQGGLWRTTNGGTNWTPLTDRAPSLATGSLAVPPASAGCTGTSSNTVYIGTGEENFAIDSYYGAGVLKCTFSSGTYSCARPANQTFGSYTIGSAPLNQDSGGPYIGGLAVDPQNPSILLASVQGYQSVLQSGIWCSADGGSSWNHVLPSVTQVVGTGVAFDQAGYAYAALGDLYGGANTGHTSVNGVYKSSAALTSSCSANFSQLGGLTSLVSPSNMGRIAISVHSGSSQSTDEIFAAIANASDGSSSLLGVFKSTNGGSSWTQPSTASLVTSSGGFCNNQCFYDLRIEIDPHNPAVIYAGGAAPGNGATIIASTNGGSTWTDVANNANSGPGVHVDTHAFAFAPPGTSGTATKLYVGTDGGAWSTANPETPTASQSWTNLNQTLALTQFYSGLSNNPAGWEYRTFGGAQDNGAQVFGQQAGTSNPLAWDDILVCGDGAVTQVDPLIPSTVYAECAYIPGVIGNVFKSVLNGNASNSSTSPSTTFTQADNGINFSDDGNFIPPLAIDPEQTGSTGDAQTLYFGTYRVWQTTDSGRNWNAISPDVTGAASSNSSVNSYCQQYPSACVLSALAVAPTDSNEVVAGSSVGFVYLSTDAGQGASSNWTDVTGSGLPPRSITQVAVDPSSSNTFYATFSGFSGFNGDNAGHVFVGTVTPGTTPSVAWTDVSSGTVCASPSGDLPNIPVNDIIVDPNQAGQLFVATDVGVFVGELQGTAPAYTGGCWTPLGSGLPNSAVLALSLNNASRTLIAGTHGRSAWAVALGDQQPFHLESLSPTSADAGSSTLTLKLVGQGFTSSSTVNWTVNGSTPSNCSVSITNVASTTTITKESAMQITASVPSGCLATGGIADVSVSDPSQTPPSTNSLPFTITTKVPTVTQISPTTGTTSSNITVSVTGTGFLPGTTTVGLASEVAPLPCSPLTPASGATSTSLTANLPGSCLQYGGIFFVTADNPQPGGGSSNPFLIAAASPLGTACTGMSTPGCLLTVTGPAPANDAMSSATSIGSGTFTATQDTSGATTSSSDPAIPSSCTTVSSANNNGDFKSVWYKYTPSSNVTAEVDTIGSNYDTILSAWTSSSTGSVPPLPATPFAQPPIYLILALTLAVFLLALAFRRRRPFSRRFATALALALLAGSLAFEGACGGGGGGTTPVPPPSNGGLTNVACNDDIGAGSSLVSQITNLSLSANTTYYFMVTDWGVPVYDGSGNVTSVSPAGGKLVLNLNAK